MDWANDQLGRLVHATDKRLFAYGFTCPTCSERVRRRAGPERRPHFAHYSHSAKPDCENYHPSSYEAIAVAAKVWEETRPTFERLSLRGGLFLNRGDSGRFSLTLKLPRLKPEIEIQGEVQIRSSLGVRTYTASQLRRSQFLPVAPKLPLVEVSASNDLRDAVAAIEEDISLFRASGNIFRAGSETDRLLAPEEPLEWGASYRVFTQYSLMPIPIELRCEQVAQGGSKGWYLYEVELPEASETIDASVQEAVARFLGRVVRLPSPRIVIVDPPPHHIDPDGTYVYPAPPERILLKRTGGSELNVEGSALSDATIVRENGIDWIEIEGLGVGEFVVLRNGHVQLAGRIDDCEFFRPEGVQVLVGDKCWEIFEKGLRHDLESRPLEPVAIQCPTSRIADATQLKNEQWDRRGTFFSLRAPLPRLQIDAGNFGALLWPEESKVAKTSPQKSFDSRIEARRVWIEGLVARVAGQDELFRLRESWVRGNGEIFSAIHRAELHWLYPYLLLVREQGRPTSE